MRIALLADIHGNLPAFEAALEHVTSQHPDLVVLAGDVVCGAPDSAACWKLARSLGCPIIRGNHERYVAAYGEPTAPLIWQTEQFAPVRWASDQFNAEERAEIAALPLHFRPPEFPDLLVVHASLQNDRDTIAAFTPEAELADMFPGVSEQIIVRAHNHAPAVRFWQERLIITIGSVGLPLNLIPTAQYLILEQRPSGWSIQHQSTPYDVDRALRRFHESGYLESAGVMAGLYAREVATASGYIVPFLHTYERWNATEPITLDTAVTRFLNEI